MGTTLVRTQKCQTAPCRQRQWPACKIGVRRSMLVSAAFTKQDNGAVAPRELSVASCKMASMQNTVRSPTQLFVVRPHPLRLIWKGLQITRFRLHGSGIFIEV